MTKARVRKIDARMIPFARLRRRYLSRARTTAVKARIIAMYTTALVGSAGWGNAWRPLSLNAGAIARTMSWETARVSLMIAFDAISRRMGGYSREIRPKATVPAIFSMGTWTIAPFAVPGT